MDNLVNTPEDAERILRMIRDIDTPKCIDVETSGLDWRVNHVVGYVFTFSTDPEDSYYVPVRHAGGGNLEGCHVPLDHLNEETPDQHWFETEVAKLMKTQDRLWIGHNLAFDLGMMAKHDIHLDTQVECTQVNAALLNENAKAYSLDQCCSRAKVQTKKGQALYDHLSNNFGCKATSRDSMGHFWRLSGDDPVAVNYAVGDGTSTIQLWEKQNEGIVDDDLQRVHALEKRVTKLLHKMHWRGFPINLTRLERFIKTLETTIEENKAKYGGINIKSAKQLIPLFEAAGINDFPLTEKGNISIKTEWLETTDLGREIIQARASRNFLESFALPLLEKHMYKGRVHPNFNQLKGDEYGVVTGRLSSNSPNSQGVPKRNKTLAHPYRSTHIAEEGMFWMDADYSQQEYRIFTDYSESPSLIKTYQEGGDIHQLVADNFHVERDPSAKRINLGILYRMGLDKLAHDLNCSKEQAKKYRDWHRQIIPEATEFMEEAQNVAESRGYVRSKLGRRRRYINQIGSYGAGNHIVQMSSADQTKRAMVNVDDYLSSEDAGWVVLQVHDAIGSMVDGPDTAKEVERIMADHGPNSDFPLSVPIKVDWNIGRDYAEASFGYAVE